MLCHGEHAFSEDFTTGHISTSLPLVLCAYVVYRSPAGRSVVTVNRHHVSRLVI